MTMTTLYHDGVVTAMTIHLYTDLNTYFEPKFALTSM